MKRIILSAALLVALTGAGFAQQSPDTDQKKRPVNRERANVKERSPEEMAKMFTASLDKQLNLSEAQEKEIYNIQLENVKQMQALRLERQAKAKQRHAGGRSFANRMDKINDVLTPEQRSTYQKLREERMKKMEERRAQYQNDKKSRGSDSTRDRRLRPGKVK